jgi:hypothetical protein
VRRIGRYILNGLTVLSLVLCVLTATFWVRGQSTVDWFMWRTETQSFFIETGAGQVRFEHTRAINDWIYRNPGLFHRTDKADGLLELSERLPGSRQHFRGAGFWFVTGERWGDDHVALFVPAWFAFAAFFALPLARGMVRFRRRVRDATLCRVCSYDLRATPDRCPECGMIPTKVKA